MRGSPTGAVIMSQSDHRSERHSLEPGQQRDAQRRQKPSPKVVFEAVRREGEMELARPLRGLAWSGLAAGLSMGFSFVTEALLYTHTPDYSWRPIVAALGYSVGFMLVILGRQQLFTENTLTPVLELLRTKRGSTLRRTAVLWAVVLSANVVGTAIFAATLAGTGLFGPDIHQGFAALAAHHYEAGFWVTLLRAVFAGWLIALMVWLLPFAESARVAVIIIVTYVIGLAGFSHIIAGSIGGLYSVFSGDESFAAFLGVFFAPTLIGNIVGGVALVAAINYAQVVHGQPGA